MTKSAKLVRSEIRQMRKAEHSYQRIADFYSTEKRKINRGTIYKILKYGYEPHDEDIRTALGLPPGITMYPCVSCGIIHPVVKRCRQVRIIGRWDDLPIKILRKAIENREEF